MEKLKMPEEIWAYKAGQTYPDAGNNCHWVEKSDGNGTTPYTRTDIYQRKAELADRLAAVLTECMYQDINGFTLNTLRIKNVLAAYEEESK